VVGVVALVALGCASSGWPKFVGQDDLKMVAGTWRGGLIGHTGGLLPMGVTIDADGTYVTTAEAYSSRGTASVRDGALVLQSAAAPGSPAADRSAVATVSQRDDGTLVLTGSGRSEAGPFAFVVTQLKK
jgi:hypothetical protein